MSAGIVEHSILHYVLQYAFAVLQYAFCHIVAPLINTCIESLWNPIGKTHGHRPLVI